MPLQGMRKIKGLPPGSLTVMRERCPLGAALACRSSFLMGVPLSSQTGSDTSQTRPLSSPRR